MQLKVFYSDVGVTKRISIVEEFYFETKKLRPIQQRVLPLDCDPALWKSTIIDQVNFDCLNMIITCGFIDGEVQLLKMSKNCHDLFSSLFERLKELESLEPTASEQISGTLSKAFSMETEGPQKKANEAQGWMRGRQDRFSTQKLFSMNNRQSIHKSTNKIGNGNAFGVPLHSETTGQDSTGKREDVIVSYDLDAIQARYKKLGNQTNFNPSRIIDMQHMGAFKRTSDSQYSGLVKGVSKIRSQILDAYQRFVLQQLKLPQNSALWSAESSLLKQEKKLLEIDSELDKQTLVVQEKKKTLKDLRTKFINDIDQDESLLQKCGPIYLEVILEGLEQDITDINKDLVISQANVERTKKKVEDLRLSLSKDQPLESPISPIDNITPQVLNLQIKESNHNNDQKSNGNESNNINNGNLITEEESNQSSSGVVEKSNNLENEEMLQQMENNLVNSRKERDDFWSRANLLIEAREKCKYELKQRKKDLDRDLVPLCGLNSGEHQYLAEQRSLHELRVSRDFLSHDKIMAVNAREISKMEIKNINDSLSIYFQRCEQEKLRKRKMRRQTWIARPQSTSFSD